MLTRRPARSSCGNSALWQMAELVDGQPQAEPEDSAEQELSTAPLPPGSLGGWAWGEEGVTGLCL